MLGAKPLGSAVTVVIAGELDHFAAPQIRRRLDELLEDQTITQPGAGPGEPDFHGFLGDRDAAGAAARAAGAWRKPERNAHAAAGGKAVPPFRAGPRDRRGG